MKGNLCGVLKEWKPSAVSGGRAGIERGGQVGPRATNKRPPRAPVAMGSDGVVADGKREDSNLRTKDPKCREQPPRIACESCRGTARTQDDPDPAAGPCSPTMWLWLLALLGLWLLRRWHLGQQTVPGLDEKFVLITGCDSGFGSLLARQLDARGLRVLAGCLTESGAARLRAAASSRLQTVLLDVTSSHSIAAAAAWVQERVGERGLWGLVNNAGIAVPAAPNEWLRKEDFVAVLNVNLVGLIEVTLSLLPLVKKARGRVVNVASVVGRLSIFGGGYCPSKFGVEAFSDSLRREMRPFGVKVSIIEPGGFRTGMTDPKAAAKELERLWSQLPVEIRASYGRGYLETYANRSALLHRLSSPRLSRVTTRMQHALLSRSPRSRYAAGWDALLFLLPLSYCPTWLCDAFISFVMPKPFYGAPAAF
ncbi:retinol dehydrogenase 7-like isoform X2 [Excalfactoria chinensis]|uniref:retinol dehydrogenase 7-like isoform X2 n=1 Tax=Excalfactoria chinensis TaxID=46218 RepID=UPI003B3A1CAF